MILLDDFTCHFTLNTETDLKKNVEEESSMEERR